MNYLCKIFPVKTKNNYFFDEVSVQPIIDFILNKKIKVIVIGPGIRKNVKKQNFVKEL